MTKADAFAAPRAREIFFLQQFPKVQMGRRGIALQKANTTVGRRMIGRDRWRSRMP